jgi:hypothetical protein
LTVRCAAKEGRQMQQHSKEILPKIIRLYPQNA